MGHAGMAAAAVRYLKADTGSRAAATDAADRRPGTTIAQPVVEALPRPDLRCVGENERAPVDQATFRRVLGNFATGVTVITAPALALALAPAPAPAPAPTRAADDSDPDPDPTELPTQLPTEHPDDHPAGLRLPVLLLPLPGPAAGRVHGRPYVDDLAPDRPRGRLLRERTRRGPERVVPSLRGERRGQVRRCRPRPGPRHGLPASPAPPPGSTARSTPYTPAATT